MNKKIIAILMTVMLTLTACNGKIDKYIDDFNQDETAPVYAEHEKKEKIIFLLLKENNKILDAKEVEESLLQTYDSLVDMNKEKYTVALAYENEKEDPIAVIKNGKFTINKIEAREGLLAGEERPDPKEYFAKIIEGTNEEKDFDEDEFDTDNVNDKDKKDEKNKDKSKNKKDETEEDKDEDKEKDSEKDTKDNKKDKDDNGQTTTIKKKEEQKGPFEKDYAAKTLTYKLKQNQEIENAQELKSEVTKISEDALKDLGKGYTVLVKDSYANVIIELKDGEIKEDMIQDGQTIKSESKSIVVESIEEEGAESNEANNNDNNSTSKDTDTNLRLEDLDASGIINGFMNGLSNKDNKTKDSKKDTKSKKEKNDKKDTKDNSNKKMKPEDPDKMD